MRRPARDTDLSTRRITRRGLIVGGIQGAFLGVLVWRMRQLQLVESDQYRLQAEENRIDVRLMAPTRGLIYDRNGVALTQNIPDYRVTIVPEEAGDVERVIARLRQIVPISESERNRAVERAHSRLSHQAITLADQLTWEQIAEVQANAPALPGVTAEVGLSRRYPMGADMAHVVGYVGAVSPYYLSKLENPDPVLHTPGFEVGKTGVEAKEDLTLRGTASTRRVEVNAAGRVMRELDRAQGTPGAELQLTIDHALQNFVVERLGLEPSASATVMDVRNGDILAIASSPTFDPNLFVRGISSVDYAALTENPYRPLAAKAVQGAYPPGSTFKMVTALAALEAGVINPNDGVYCPGHMEVSGRKFHCWRRGGHGYVNLTQALQQSCDVYFYDISLKVGIDKIAEMARKLGLDDDFDLPLSAVTTGLVPNKAWKKRRYDKDWVLGDTLNASIGQGFVLSSAMQLATMTARIASGTDVRPRLVRMINGQPPEGPGPQPLGISTSNLNAVRKGMYAVSNTKRGTAYKMRILDQAMAGKTGTSQVRNISAAERARGVFRNQDLPWERRDHALFVCYAPYENPRIAVSVVVEHGGGGSTAAAPVARDILLQALHDGLPPLSAYPNAYHSQIREMRDTLTLKPRIEPADNPREAPDPGDPAPASPATGGRRA